MYGGIPFGAGPYGAGLSIPAAVIVEADGQLTAAATAAFQIARVRAAAGVMNQRSVTAMAGVRIAQSTLSADDQEVDLFLDGVVFDAGGYLFDAIQRASSTWRGAAIRQSTGAATQASLNAWEAAKIQAGATAMVQGVSASFQRAMIATADGTILAQASVFMEPAAIRAAGLTAVQRAVVTFLAAKVIDTLPEYAVKRPAEMRGMRVPLR